MSDLESEYRLEYFEENGFQRRECASCDAYFWTRDADRTICGEPPCGEYTFIDNPGFDRSYTLAEMRETFLAFFEEHGHERVDPYPVAANRWRDDVLLTQASIYDFQPHVTSGEAPPPANPLTISQPSIRMEDIDNVGKTGRHTMAFEMMAHHAFNTREDVPEDAYAYHGEVYWKDETVEYCDEFFESLGVDLADIVYIEYPWAGGGNAGPALEVIYEGVELATLVFMNMERDPGGEYDLPDGNRYSKMDTYVVDTGYGLERWTWVSQGTPTVYEAVYPDMIAFLKEQAGVDHTPDERDIVHAAAAEAGHMDIEEIENVTAARETMADEIGIDRAALDDLLQPLEAVYAIADHCRTLAYMFGDEIVPSNVGTGYLARMVLRRTKRLCDTADVDAPLDELVDMQADRLGYENRDTIRDIVRTEVEKYRETLERGGRRVRTTATEYADRNEPIPTEELIELYDSHGIHPDMVAEIAADVGAEVDIPSNFYGLVAERHERDEESDDEPVAAGRVEELPDTERLYYEDPSGTTFEAMVLDVFERDEGYDVVLDQTMFYPEGGGQPSDRGTLETDERSTDVRDVQRRDGVIYHVTDTDPGKGEFVKGRLDADRRRRLMAHHSATHIIGHAARQHLGEHVRQAGAQKGTDRARLDVTHFQRIDRDAANAIEQIANGIVRDNVPVTSEWPHRNDAEAEHGFDLYQGGIPPGEHIRLITIDEDVQACGGTHVARTGDIGLIKVTATERIQDGVERLTFAAGAAAIEAIQATDDLLNETASVLDVTPEDVPETAERFFEAWKERGKELDALREDLAAARAAAADEGDRVTFDGGEAVVRRLDADADELQAMANAIAAEGNVAVLGSGVEGAHFVVAVPDALDLNAGAVVSRLAERVGGGGGGPPDFAQGGGPDVGALDDALSEAPDLLEQALDA